MRAHILAATVFTLGVAFAFGTPAISADLPQSGTMKLHSTIKGTASRRRRRKTPHGQRQRWGVTFNDAGSGPLHMGGWMCTWTFQNVSSPTQISGNCAFGDAGGRTKIIQHFQERLLRA